MLTKNQIEILRLMVEEAVSALSEVREFRWWSAMDIIQKLGEGTGAGIGCAMKGLYKRKYLTRLAALRKEGRNQTLYRLTADGLDKAKLEF